MSEKKPAESDLERRDDQVPGWFSEKSYSNITQDKITLARNMSLGSAGLAVLAIFRLSMAPELSAALSVALYAFTLATPLFVALAFWYEAFVWLGEDSYEYFNARRGQVDKWASLPMLALYLGVVAIVWHLSVAAGIVFLLVSALALYLLQRNLEKMRSYLDQNDNN